MRKTKETHTFDFRPLGLAIREARERAGLSRNDLGDKVFYGERHIADAPGQPTVRKRWYGGASTALTMVRNTATTPRALRKVSCRKPS